ncbi:hypothetical protein LWI29_018330 [Acer saccharum]|uniref:Uncharacterized protein n=1 Tax=Acer saccharum TaxID=4024 RepID=A0AA39RF52_ACESA|nr:hypothetical protein LWI29_018330 [Acer saccharum]
MMMELITTVAYSFRNMVLLIMNYNGQWEDGQFNPKAVFFLSMTLEETLKTLTEKICSRFGLNCDEVDFKISTRIDGSIVEMIYDLDLQIFISHNKENPKCYVSMFHKQLRSQVKQLTVPPDLKSKSMSITFGSTGDQACMPPPMMKCKSTLCPIVSLFGYRSTTGSNECVPSGSPVDESNTSPSIKKSIFPQSPLVTVDFDYAKDEKVDCPTIVTAEKDGMGCSPNIKSSLCPYLNDIHPQDLPLHPKHDDNPLHLVDLISLSAAGINKNLSGPEHELKLRRRFGRQRKSIKKYNQETCSNCSEKGHNKSGCRKPMFDASWLTKPPRTCRAQPEFTPNNTAIANLSELTRLDFTRRVTAAAVGAVLAEERDLNLWRRSSMYWEFLHNFGSKVLVQYVPSSGNVLADLLAKLGALSGQLVEVVEPVECTSLVVQSLGVELLNVVIELYRLLASSLGHSWMTLQDQSSS